jgi:hypothetical protein
MPRTKYPELQRALERQFRRWWERKRGVGPLPSVRALAEMIKKETGVTITHSSLLDWKRGISKPQTEKMNALVDFFASGDPKEKETLKSALDRATQDGNVLVDSMEVLESGGRPLNVGIVYFPNFCQLENGRPNGFLDSLLHRYLSFASLESKSTNYFEAELSEIEKDLCSDGNMDIAAGLFVEPSRTRNLWFYSFPISIPLNGVRIRPGIPELLNIMTSEMPSTTKRRILPIVDPKELGGIYALQFINISDPVRVNYNLTEYASELKRLSESETPRLPLCIIDEVSCCLVLEQVRGLLLAEAKNDKELNLVSARPEYGFCEHFFPRYRYGIAIARHQTEWIQFFEQTFEIFLEANIELVARMYSKLYYDLVQDLPKFERRIRDWLGLDKKFRETRNISPAWAAILSHAEKLISDSDKTNPETTQHTIPAEEPTAQ